MWIFICLNNIVISDLKWITLMGEKMKMLRLGTYILKIVLKHQTSNTKFSDKMVKLLINHHQISLKMINVFIKICDSRGRN